MSAKWLLLSLFLIGCGAQQAPVIAAELPAGPEGTRLWQAALHELALLRGRYAPAAPYTINLSLTLRQPQLGVSMRARGAVAVVPSKALRMILLGPGGTTALDLWLCGDAFRFAVPALDLLRRGDQSSPRKQRRGLPVDFLRWWFLRPLRGRLLHVLPWSDGKRWMLRDDAHWVRLLSSASGALEIRRRASDELETLRVDGPGCGRVLYQQRSTGLHIEVECESLRSGEQAPPAKAFADPDDPTKACVAGRSDPAEVMRSD